MGRPKPLTGKIKFDLMNMTVSVCQDCGALIEGTLLFCGYCEARREYEKLPWWKQLVRDAPTTPANLRLKEV